MPDYPTDELPSGLNTKSSLAAADLLVIGDSVSGDAAAIRADEAISDAGLFMSDITTNNFSTSQHGFTPKSPGGTTEFLRADGTWDVPPGTASTNADYTTDGTVQMATQADVSAGTQIGTTGAFLAMGPDTFQQALIDQGIVTGAVTLIAGENISLGAPTYLKMSDGKAYNASSASANEAFYSYIGIATATATTGNSITIATLDGTIITGLSLPAATETISQTADWSQALSGSNDSAIYSGQDSPYYIWRTGSQVNNLSQITATLGKTGTGGGILTMTIYAVTLSNVTATIGSSLGSVAINSPSPGANNFVFSSPISVEPNTFYAIQYSAASGDGSNYWSQSYLSSSPPKPVMKWTGSVLSFFGPTITTYYTSQINWTVGDNIFMSDTPGTINTISPGTNPLVIGTIISSSSIIMRSMNGNRYMGTSPATTASSGSSDAVFIIPKNCTRITILVPYTSSLTSTKGFDVRIGDQVAQCLVVDDTHSGTVSYDFIGSFGSFGEIVATYLSNITVWFYK